MDETHVPEFIPAIETLEDGMPSAGEIIAGMIASGAIRYMGTKELYDAR